MGSAGLPVFRVGPLVRLTRVPRNSAGRFWIPTIRPCERADSRQQSSGSVRRTLSFPNESIEKDGAALTPRFPHVQSGLRKPRKARIGLTDSPLSPKAETVGHRDANFHKRGSHLAGKPLPFGCSFRRSYRGKKQQLRRPAGSNTAPIIASGRLVSIHSLLTPAKKSPNAGRSCGTPRTRLPKSMIRAASATAKPPVAAPNPDACPASRRCSKRAWFSRTDRDLRERSAATSR